MKSFADITTDQFSRGNVAISIPEFAISHLPIRRVTEKAICIEVNNSSWVHQSIKNVWLPISQIDVIETYTKKNFEDSDPKSEKENCLYFEINLPEWLVKKNKLG